MRIERDIEQEVRGGMSLMLSYAAGGVSLGVGVCSSIVDAGFLEGLTIAWVGEGTGRGCGDVCFAIISA